MALAVGGRRWAMIIPLTEGVSMQRMKPKTLPDMSTSYQLKTAMPGRPLDPRSMTLIRLWDRVTQPRTRISSRTDWLQTVRIWPRFSGHSPHAQKCDSVTFYSLQSDWHVICVLHSHHPARAELLVKVLGFERPSNGLATIVEDAVGALFSATRPGHGWEIKQCESEANTEGKRVTQGLNNAG